MIIYDNKWRQLIRETQRQIIEPNYVIECAQQFEAEWNDNELGKLPPAASQLPFIVPPGVRAGYDMPMLIQPKTQSTGKIVALVAQDPLRNKQCGDGMTVGTPFGFHSSHMRSKGHYGMIWSWVERLNQIGVTVYFTDARKLYASDKSHLVDVKTQYDVLKRELDFINPDRIFAFGRQPEWVLRKNGIEAQYLVHPAHFITTEQRQAIGDTIVEAMKSNCIR